MRYSEDAHLSARREVLRAARNARWRTRLAAVADFMILMLPYPPSNNRYYRHWKGRVLLSREGHAYRKAGVAAAHGRPGLPILGLVRVVLNVFPPTRWGQDLDNIPKAICDALQAAGVLENDRQIAELHVIRKPKAESPCVMVGIERIEEAA